MPVPRFLPRVGAHGSVVTSLALTDTENDGDLDIFLSYAMANQVTTTSRAFYIRNDGLPHLVDATDSFGADLTKWVEFDFLYNLFVGVPSFGQTNHHSESVFSIDLFGPVDLDFTFVFDRQEDPQREDDDDDVKKNDFRSIVGLGVDF